MGGSGPGNSIATSGGCRTWPCAFSNASGQASHLGDTRLGSLAAGPAARSVGRLGRWAGTTPTVEAHGRLAFEQVCGANVVMKKVISFEILIPYIHSTWIGDQAL